MKHVIAVLLTGYFSLNAAVARADGNFNTPQILTQMRDDIGKPLLETSLNIINNGTLVVEKINPQGASFFAGGLKTALQSVDELRTAHPFIIAMTTCPNASSLEARIETISVWEDIGDDSERGAIASAMQQMLEAMNNPPAVQTPSVMRAPQTKGLRGVIFEYNRGDTKEQFSLLNESSAPAGRGLKLQWSINNEAVCATK